MCFGGAGKVFAPVPAPVAKVYDKITPAPMKKVDLLPARAISRALGEDTTSKIVNGGLSTPARDEGVKTLLGN